MPNLDLVVCRIRGSTTGLDVGLALKRSCVRRQLCNDSGQVVPSFSNLCQLSPIWYRLTGLDALQMGR